MKNHTHIVADATIERLESPEEADSTPMFATHYHPVAFVECIQRIHSHFSGLLRRIEILLSELKSCH
jgi:hypothetical protein